MYRRENSVAKVASRTIGGKVEVSSPEYRRAYPEMNAVVREVCEETGARYFDFASAFPKDKALYVDGRHVTLGGARRKAALFAEFLEQNVLVGDLAPDR